MNAFLVNLAVALLWPLLTGDFNGARFAAGFLVGFVLLALFQPVVNSGPYVRRSVAAVVFVAVLLQQYTISSLRTLWTTLLTPRARLQPRVIRYNAADLTELQRLLLAHAITLTPGTAVVESAPDHSHLLVHVLDGQHPAAVHASIDRTLRRAIVALTQ